MPESEDFGYVALAGEFARKIRSGELPPATQLPSYTEIGADYKVGESVVRKTIKLLESQGLVYSIRRRGVFVAKVPTLARVSPERQMETAEETYVNEAEVDAVIERELEEITAPTTLVNEFSLTRGDKVARTVTRAISGRRPISISDTYQPVGVEGISDAATLEETLRDGLPSTEHAEWLGTSPGKLVKLVRQRFRDADGRLVMLSDISYPLDRYDSFVFDMNMDRE